MYKHLHSLIYTYTDVLGNNSKLILKRAFGSSDKGGLEFDITDIRPTNTAYGIVWRVQQTSSNKSYYIPQVGGVYLLGCTVYTCMGAQYLLKILLCVFVASALLAESK